MPNISQIQNPQGFAQDFLKHYLASGFGGMQKRDLDTLVFGLLLKYGAYGPSADAPDATDISFQLESALPAFGTCCATHSCVICNTTSTRRKFG